MLKNLANEINNILNDNEVKAEEIKRLEERIVELENNTATNEEVNILNEKIANLNEEIARLNNQNSSLNAELISLQDEHANCLGNYNTLEEEKEELEKTVADLQLQLEVTKETHSKCDSSIEELNSQIAVLETQANINLNEVKNIVEELKGLINNA